MSSTSATATATASASTKQVRRRVCLFGTSANPPTGDGGHVGIVKALSGLNRFDEIRVLPVYQHMFAAKRNQLVDFHHRIKMCELAFSGIAKVHVSTAEQVSFEKMAEGISEEKRQSLRVGTADLLDMLLDDEPNVDFSFCLGADTFVDLTEWKWRRARDVFRLLEGRLVVLFRQGDSSKTDDYLEELVGRINQSESAQVELLNVPTLNDVSSSAVRSCNDEERLSKMLRKNVLDYVKANGLYTFMPVTEPKK